MKKLVIPLLIVLLLLPGCKIKEFFTDLFTDTKESYENVSDKANEIIDDFNNKKEKLEEKAEQLENAVNSLKKASDAVQEVFE